MSVTLYELALNIQTKGATEATRALGELDAAGKRVATSLSAPNAAFDKTTRKIEESRVKFAEWQRELAQTRGAASHATAVNSMAKAHTGATLTADKLRGGLASLAAQATGVNSSISSLASVLGSFALGGAVTSAVLIGISAIAFAYDKITKSAREAKDEIKRMNDELDRQIKSRFESSVEGQQARLRSLATEFAAAQAQLQKAQGGRAFGSVVGGGLMVDPGQVAAAEANLARVMARIREAGIQLGDVMQQNVTPKVEKATKAINDQIDALEKLPAAIHLQFEGLSQFEKGGEPVSDEIEGGVPDWMTDAFKGPRGVDAILAARKATKEAAEAAIAAAKTEAEQMQMQLAAIFSGALVGGIIQGFQDGGIAGAFKQMTQSIIAGLGQMFAAIAVKAIAASKLMVAITSFLVNHPVVALAAAVALMALASSMGGHAGGGGGGYVGSSYSGPSRATEDLVRYKFINRPDGSLANIEPRPNMTFNVFGPNDPAAQRAIGEALEKYHRRGG